MSTSVKRSPPTPTPVGLRHESPDVRRPPEHPLPKRRRDCEFPDCIAEADRQVSRLLVSLMPQSAGPEATPGQRGDFGIDTSDTPPGAVTVHSPGLGRSMEITGSPAYCKTVLEHLKKLAGTKTGQALLEGIDASGKCARITQTNDSNAARPTDQERTWMGPDGSPGPGSDALVFYNAYQEQFGGGAEPWMVRPPYVGLCHELAHVFDYTNGLLPRGQTHGVNNRELAAVGLSYDHDGNPETAEVKSPRPGENDLRAELGLPLRPEPG